MSMSLEQWEKIVQDKKDYISQKLKENGYNNFEILDNKEFETFTEYEKYPFLLKINNELYNIVVLKPESMLEFKSFDASLFPETKILDDNTGLVLYKNPEGLDASYYVAINLHNKDSKKIKDEASKISALLAKTIRGTKELYYPKTIVTYKKVTTQPIIYLILNKNEVSTYLFTGPNFLNAKQKLGSALCDFIEYVIHDIVGILFFSTKYYNETINGFNAFIKSIIADYLQYLETAEQKHLFLNKIEDLSNIYTMSINLKDNKNNQNTQNLPLTDKEREEIESFMKQMETKKADIELKLGTILQNSIKTIREKKDHLIKK